MIFTLGHTASYLQYFKEAEREGKIPQKMGKHQGFPGGSVWKTKEEAEIFQKKTGEDFSVFGVDADWDKDTEPSPGGKWNSLLSNKNLIMLTDAKKPHPKLCQ